jgi:uncharacterized protein
LEPADVRVWIDLANSPHVPLAVPLIRGLRQRGDEVLLTARDHAQTLQLARRLWPEVRVVGGSSPPGRLKKGLSIGARASTLRHFGRTEQPDVAFSHGSYAQIVAARAAGIPAVTMMDYEHQPANHLSFRLAQRIIVPDVFPEAALKRFGARPGKVVRYPGFKEQFYLDGFEADPKVLAELGLSPAKIIAVFRPPPEGALYHGGGNGRFNDVLDEARQRKDVQVVLLPRTQEQAERYADGVLVAEGIDALSLLAFADLAVGAGGTMNRESAILGTPTYTVFAGKLAAVDRALIQEGRLRDLRAPGFSVDFVKKPGSAASGSGAASEIFERVLAAIESVAKRR